MNDVRSPTSLSDSDYDAIAAAVMETSRGRWFMNEFARRNRHADTQQLLTAIERIERAVGPAASDQAAGLLDTAALIADLRSDLERINTRSDHPSNGLAERIDEAAGTIVTAVESVQELAWSMREAGVDEALCDRLDRRATEIFAAGTVVEGGARQVAKILDTVAMIDSSLRALAEGVEPCAGARENQVETIDFEEPAMPSASARLDFVEIDDTPRSSLAAAPVPPRPAVPTRVGSLPCLEDDLVFADSADPTPPTSAPERWSEEAMRAIDAMPTAEKLAYFA